MDDVVEVLMMFLGVQDPESRKKARNMKRKDAENDIGNDHSRMDLTRG